MPAVKCIDNFSVVNTVDEKKENSSSDLDRLNGKIESDQIVKSD